MLELEGGRVIIVKQQKCLDFRRKRLVNFVESRKNEKKAVNAKLDGERKTSLGLPQLLPPFVPILCRSPPVFG